MSLSKNLLFSRILLFTILLYFLKFTFWPITFLFVPFYICLLGLFIIITKGKIKLKDFISCFKIPLLMVFILIIYEIISLQTNKELLFKETVHQLIIFSFFYFLLWNFKDLIEKISLKSVTSWIVYSISVIALINLLRILASNYLQESVLIKFHISTGTTLTDDYNFFSLFLLFGLILNNFNSTKQKSTFNSIAAYFINILLLINVIIAGSRRAIFCLVLLIIIYILYNGFILRNFKIKVYSILVYIIVLFFAIFFVYKKISKVVIFDTLTHYSSILGLQNNKELENTILKKEIARTVHGNNIISTDFFERNPKYWNKINSSGTILTNIITDYGKGKIIKHNSSKPEGFALAYIGPEIIYYANHTYEISFKIKLLEGSIDSFCVGLMNSVNDSIIESVNPINLNKEITKIENGWYICKSTFLFENNHIGLIGFINSVRNKTEFILADFSLVDLDYDYTLPKFRIEIVGRDQSVNWINKINNIDHSDQNLLTNWNFKDELNYWDYDTSNFKINLQKQNNTNIAFVSSRTSEFSKSIFKYTGEEFLLEKGFNYKVNLKVKLLTTSNLPFKIGFYNTNRYYLGDSIFLNISVDTLMDKWLYITANYLPQKSSRNMSLFLFFNADSSKLLISDISLKKQPINQSDSNYNSFENNTVKSTMNSKNFVLFDSRIDHWKFAYYLWTTKYKWYHKLFGRGYNYYEWYGEKFFNDKKRADWPHNPFLGILLTMGVFGLLLYIYLLYYVFLYYIKFASKYGLLFLLFLITFFFSFFSGNTPFDPPIMGFFILVPFFIHHLDKNHNIY